MGYDVVFFKLFHGIVILVFIDRANKIFNSLNNMNFMNFFVHLKVLLQMVMDLLFFHLLYTISHGHLIYLMYVSIDQ